LLNLQQQFKHTKIEKKKKENTFIIEMLYTQSLT